MTGPLGWMDRVEADALRTDRYLEALLASSERGAADAPADADLEAGIREVARRLHAEAVLIHPSFRFEERLARRLAEAAAETRLAAAVGGEGASPVAALNATFEQDPLGRHTRPATMRPLLVGGALTSAAISIAGAAFVAWRRARTTPFAVAGVPGPAPRHRFAARVRLD